MIQYDSHEWDIYFKIRGSIFPRALLSALPSAVLAFAIRYWELFTLELTDLTGSSVYSGFTFVLGFILVFRTSQSYQRYWHAATAVHNMKAEWLDACGSLIAFAQTSKMGQDCIMRFAHSMIRLFGLMHAMALEEIAGSGDHVRFPLLDIDGLRKEDLRVLTTPAAQGRKVEIVCQWIKVNILMHMDEGVLNVPPPILTRVFQELGTGLVNYHDALQVVIWPFPFPYAQMSAVLIAVYMAISPIVISMGADDPVYCFVLTFISIVCMKGIDMIAIELENPFGDDPNDLPIATMHAAVNRDLTLLVNPETWTIPQLLETAVMSYDELMSWNNTSKMSSLIEACSFNDSGEDSSSLCQPFNMPSQSTLSSYRPQNSLSPAGAAIVRHQVSPVERQPTLTVAHSMTSSRSFTPQRGSLPRMQTPTSLTSLRIRRTKSKNEKMASWHNEEWGSSSRRTAEMLGIRIFGPSMHIDEQSFAVPDPPAGEPSRLQCPTRSQHRTRSAPPAPPRRDATLPDIQEVGQSTAHGLAAAGHGPTREGGAPPGRTDDDDGEGGHGPTAREATARADQQRCALPTRTISPQWPGQEDPAYEKTLQISSQGSSKERPPALADFSALNSPSVSSVSEKSLAP